MSHKDNNVFVALWFHHENDGTKVFYFDTATQAVTKEDEDITLTNSWALDVNGDSKYIYLSNYPRISGGSGGIKVYSYEQHQPLQLAPSVTTTTAALSQTGISRLF